MGSEDIETFLESYRMGKKAQLRIFVISFLRIRNGQNIFGELIKRPQPKKAKIILYIRLQKAICS